MERPLFKPVGTPVRQLDTPALVADLTVLERNITTVHAFFQQHEVKLRPHVSTHRCPPIAHMQLAAGGTVGGISVTTVGEAEVFAAHGFTNIFVANEVITPAKIGRLCALPYPVTITVAVDHPKQIRNLSAAATTHNVTLRVVVDIQTSTDRCGVAAGQPALELARTVEQAAGLDFVGLMTTAEPILSEDFTTVADESRRVLQPVVETRELLEKDGIEVQVVSVGGTSNYEIAGSMTGVTEVRAGTYALMDARYDPCCPRLQSAARVLTTIASRPETGAAITDAGQKAIGIDLGLPVVTEIAGVDVVGLSAEHCRLQLDTQAESQVSLGDKIWLTPWDIGTCVNLYDNLHVVRHSALEAVWSIPARGRYG
jgi:D-serine deaminase-like pyridoxal phosphate-dependent protein